MFASTFKFILSVSQIYFVIKMSFHLLLTFFLKGYRRLVDVTVVFSTDNVSCPRIQLISVLSLHKILIADAF